MQRVPQEPVESIQGVDNMRTFGGPEEGFGDSIDQVTCDIGTQRFISGFLLQQELWSHKLHCLLGCG